ncbi:hypothetical protein GOV09_02855 [Candidatus Woesearchaeota archaeon]|nr:hypothetical protein [Candidatus Woesearchaeota archaeon]
MNFLKPTKGKVWTTIFAYGAYQFADMIAGMFMFFRIGLDKIDEFLKFEEQAAEFFSSISAQELFFWDAGAFVLTILLIYLAVCFGFMIAEKS